jgi:hypothetical protein
VRVPVLCVERDPQNPATTQDLLQSLQAMSEQFTPTRGIRHFLIHPGFPVDVRHNAKIGREKLALWAQRQLA